jgi:arginyl-tRNA synthetase
MHPSLDPSDTITEAVQKAAMLLTLEDTFDPVVRPADPRFGDFQANGALPYAKRNKLNPRELATRLIAAIEAHELMDPSSMEWTIAGPGFINFKLSPDYLLNWMRQFGTESDLKKALPVSAGRTVVIDFSSPNTAKEMHVGHIRSTVIGDTLARLLEFSGARVIRDNHIGDWGTQFGMLIHAIKADNYDPLAADPATAVAELEALYKKGHAAYKASEANAEAIRRELLDLQSGNPESLRIWEAITAASWRAFEAIYGDLDIHFDVVLGESFYRDRLGPVYEELQTNEISQEDDGALVVFHPGHKRFAKQPFIIRKKDGASNYASTDLATVLYRCEEWSANELIYVVDSRQSDHFEQLFLTVQRWFEATGRACPKLTHVAFGTILGEDNKPIKTKEGGSVKLRELLAEAVERSGAIVREKNPELSEEETLAVARAVGLGAVRYGDLSQNRTSDYVFAWDRMLSFEGNTAPYLLYAVARIRSIFRKAGVSAEDPFALASAPESPEELALARKLTEFAGTFKSALNDLRPHLLATWLFELAGQFSSFYNANKVLVEDPDIRERRFLLCARTLQFLETGLQLLGLRTLDRM